MDTECDPPESRHGKFADDTHRFQISFRASVPGELELFDDLTVAAHNDGVTKADFVREALRRHLRARRYRR